MAFPRARLRRFNETKENTPGVGAYNLAQTKLNDKTGSLARINETLKNCRDKALTATDNGTLPKHVEEIHTKLAQAQERVLDLEILKIGWDKQRELNETEKIDLRHKLTKLEDFEEKFYRVENDRQSLEEQIKGFSKKIHSLEKEERLRQSKVTETEKKKEELEKEKLQVSTELDTLKNIFTEMESTVKRQENEIKKLHKNLSDVQNELDLRKEECEKLKKKQEIITADFRNEKDSLISQVESLTLKYSEWKDKFTKSSECNTEEIGALLEANVQKVSEIEEKKQALETLESQFEETVKQMKGHEKLLQEKVIFLEENQSRLEKGSEVLTKELCRLEQDKKNLDKECANMAEDLTTKMVEFEEEKNLLSAENLNLTSKLDQALGDVEELTQHVVFTQNKMQGNTKEIELLKQTHEKESEDFETEKQFLTSQIQSLIIKCEDYEDKLKKSSEANAKENELLRNENTQRLTEIEDSNRKLEEMVSQVEELGQHVVFTQNKLQENVKETDMLKQTHEKESENFENEKQFLIAQIQTLTIKCEDCEDELKKSSDANANENELLRNQNTQRLTEIEDINRKLEEMVSQFEDLSQHLIFTQNKLQDNVKETEVMNQTHEKESENFESEKQFLIAQIQTLAIKCEDYEDKLKKSSEANAKENELLRNENTQRLTEIEDINRKLEEMVSQVEELGQHVVFTQNKLQENVKETDILKQTHEKESDNFENEKQFLIAQIQTLTNVCEDYEDNLKKAAEANAKEVELLRFENAQSLVEIEDRNRTLEETVSQVESDKREALAQEQQLRERLILLEQAQPRLEADDKESVNDQLAAADIEIEGMNNMISEMSEKIEQFECERAELLSELDENWKAKYEDLKSRLEPFKGVLDGYELERQLLQDRDKFTNEQLEKLTHECIKNMGHQNHKQRIKYLEKLKQENLDLFKTVQELQAQVRRQEATIRKLKENTTDTTETSKKPWQRAPLKEGNRL